MKPREPIDTVRQGEARTRADGKAAFVRNAVSDASDAWTDDLHVTSEQVITRQEVWLFRIRR
jgi:hypothetical protein